MGLPPRPFDPRRFRCWHLYKDYTNGTPGLLGSHMIDIATWFMDDSLPTSCVAHGGVYVWKEREHADTLDCLYEYPKGFLLNYSTRLGNSYRIADVVFYGTRGTFDTSSWTAKSQGGGADKLTEDVKPVDEPSDGHMRNWLECVRSRQEPNAPIEAGYAHSVAAIMAFQAWETGRRQLYDAEEQEIHAG
jgi:predicted dehydrogenase